MRRPLRFFARPLAWAVSVPAFVICGALGSFALARQTASPHPGPIALAAPAAVGGPLTVRRLTEAQYRATVGDIFGEDVPIVGRFERSLREEGLLAVGASRSGLSPFAIEQYDASARGIAAAVVGEERRAKLVPCQPADATRFDHACASRFVDRYGLLLFRRPLTAAERQRYLQIVRNAQEQLGDFNRGLGQALAGMLVAPDFLFRIPRADARGKSRLDAWSRASQLSFFLTNASPDEELLRAAGAGELDSAPGLARQTDRLMASSRFERAVRAFFEDMLQFDAFDELAKDPVIYPAFNSSVLRDAQEQTKRTIVEHLLVEKGDYRDLFTTRTSYLTRALGPIYRVPVASPAGWSRIEFGAGSGRAGILTDVSFLALHAHPGRSSATLRGKSVREILLCQHVPPPPPNVDFTVVQDASNTAMPTARQRLSEHNSNPVCAGCHRLTDPIGLALENFDGLGSFRTRENGAAIDVSGSLDGADYRSPQGLGQALHDHPETPRCLVKRMYESAVGRSETEGEGPYVEFLNNAFAAAQYKLPNLMRAIALSDGFYAVSAERPAVVAFMRANGKPIQSMGGR